MAQIKGLQTSKSGSQGLVKRGSGSLVTPAQTMSLFGKALDTYSHLMEVASNERIRREEIRGTLEAIKTESYTRLKIEEEKTKQTLINAKLEYERVQADFAVSTHELDNVAVQEENRHNERIAYLEKSDVDIKKQLDSMLAQIADYRVAMNNWLEENKGKAGVDYTPYYNWMSQIGRFYEQASDLTKLFVEGTK